MNKNENENYYHNCTRSLTQMMQTGHESFTRAVYTGVNNLASPLKEEFTKQVAEKLGMSPASVMATAASYITPAVGGNKRR